MSRSNEVLLFYSDERKRLFRVLRANLGYSDRVSSNKNVFFHIRLTHSEAEWLRWNSDIKWFGVYVSLSAAARESKRLTYLFAFLMSVEIFCRKKAHNKTQKWLKICELMMIDY